MPPDKKRPRPGGDGGGPLKFVSLRSGDNSDATLDLPVSQLLPRPVRPDEIPELRGMWWRQARLGHRLPAEVGVIVIEGGRS